MSEAGWTGPSARARTRTTSKIKKGKRKKNWRWAECHVVEMYFTLVSHEKMKKDKASIQKSNNDHYYTIMHLRLRSKRRQKEQLYMGISAMIQYNVTKKKPFYPNLHTLTPPFLSSSFCAQSNPFHPFQTC